jgi:hypothetical protein
VKLRNAHLAVVERSKVVDYLLNPKHPDNGGKARFFESLGFTADDPDRLVSALLTLASTGDVVETTQSAHGEKHVVDGSVSSQTDTAVHRMVRSVWIIDRGSEAPRFVTAYPTRE